VHTPYYQCYHCNNFSTDIELEYLRHGAKEHLYKPLFPNITELQQYNLKPQGKKWEKPVRTEREAQKHLQDWVEKREREELSIRHKYRMIGQTEDEEAPTKSVIRSANFVTKHLISS
jgi:hypothetical protein